MYFAECFATLFAGATSSNKPVKMGDQGTKRFGRGRNRNFSDAHLRIGNMVI
jgi:hypothetical protein